MEWVKNLGLKDLFGGYKMNIKKFDLVNYLLLILVVSSISFFVIKKNFFQGKKVEAIKNKQISVKLVTSKDCVSNLISLLEQIKLFYEHKYNMDKLYMEYRKYIVSPFAPAGIPKSLNSIWVELASRDIVQLSKFSMEFSNISKIFESINSNFNCKTSFEYFINLSRLFSLYAEKKAVELDYLLRDKNDFDRLILAKMIASVENEFKKLETEIISYLNYMALYMNEKDVELLINLVYTKFKFISEKYILQLQNSNNDYSKVLMFAYEWPIIRIYNCLIDILASYLTYETNGSV